MTTPDRPVHLRPVNGGWILEWWWTDDPDGAVVLVVPLPSDRYLRDQPADVAVWLGALCGSPARLQVSLDRERWLALDVRLPVRVTQTWVASELRWHSWLAGHIAGFVDGTPPTG